MARELPKRIVAVALALLAVVGSALAQEERPLRVIAANAVKGGLQELSELYQEQSGRRVEITWSGTEATTRRIAGGEAFDIVLIGSDAIGKLVEAGYLAADGQKPVARTGVAMAVRSGYAPPPIGNAEAIRSAVVAAPRLAYSAGPSGAYVEALLARLGVSDLVAPKLSRPLSGAEVARLVASGQVDLAFAQVSEFLGVPGIQYLGPLRENLQNYTTYVAAVPSRGHHGDAASFIRFITSQAASNAIRTMGMEQPR
ncbi:molybdate ABC transporter substrate-binding protein [Phreatobacter oligotrophus]|uniref:Molybdate transport system substrate-binding protein n=1 Tax=Phreatobacter oligotrophus TaxID=1122261 RepID=A0A2T4YS45_9HYPH|nr:substrate-binding domain-containing protein [Phreatobacter oligotrophus]PTM46467.1 molybdate transport system substrate-binding protein [Phreatobacter oligotrophus]